MDLKYDSFDRFYEEKVGAQLPPVWQIIYNEGIRSNHILFDQEDIERFESEELVYQSGELSKSDRKLLEDVIVKVAQADSLAQMRGLIAQLEFYSRAKIFNFYKHLLDIWSYWLKRSLN